jgi:hypothetical protein
MTAQLKGITDVVAYIDKTIDNLDPERVHALVWRNDEVMEMLGEIRAGVLAQDVTWAEVTISEAIAERDRARSLAVRLEQELAQREVTR